MKCIEGAVDKGHPGESREGSKASRDGIPPNGKHSQMTNSQGVNAWLAN
jgi:hypothetical protein